MASIDVPQTPAEATSNKPALLTSDASTIASPAPPSIQPGSAEQPIFGTVIPNRIFVGGISHDTTESDLLCVFSTYGTVRSAKIIVDQDGFNKGYGFVTFETKEEAQRLQSIGRCVILRNRLLNIAPAVKRQQVRPKFQQIIDTNGTVYFTAQPQSAIGNIPINPYAAATTAGMPGIYQQTPVGLQYQPIYQYYSVPVNVPAFWQNFYGDSQASAQQAAVPQQGGAWELNGANNNIWHST